MRQFSGTIMQRFDFCFDLSTEWFYFVSGKIDVSDPHEVAGFCSYSLVNKIYTMKSR